MWTAPAFPVLVAVVDTAVTDTLDDTLVEVLTLFETTGTTVVIVIPPEVTVLVWEVVTIVLDIEVTVLETVVEMDVRPVVVVVEPKLFGNVVLANLSDEEGETAKQVYMLDNPLYCVYQWICINLQIWA